MWQNWVGKLKSYGAQGHTFVSTLETPGGCLSPLRVHMHTCAHLHPMYYFYYKINKINIFALIFAIKCTSYPVF